MVNALQPEPQPVTTTELPQTQQAQFSRGRTLGLTEGAHINRRTAETVRQAGLVIEQVDNLAPQGLVKLIIARPYSDKIR